MAKWLQRGAEAALQIQAKQSKESGLGSRSRSHTQRDRGGPPPSPPKGGTRSDPSVINGPGTVDAAILGAAKALCRI